MVKLARRRRCQAITAVTAAALLSGSVYLATSRKRPELTLEERWQIVQMAISLKREPVDWETLIPTKHIVFDSTLLSPERMSSLSAKKKRRRLQERLVPVPEYEYDRGNCPNAGQRGVPCSPNDLGKLCDKNNRAEGRFSSCLLACAPSYCCIHDTPPATNPFAPSCNDDENCAQYAPCYIAWWKLQDMVGPATEFQLGQSDDFFDVDLLQDVIMDPIFFQQLLFHHFEDIDPILELLGQADSIQEVFAMPEVWDANSSISGNPPPGIR